MPRDVEDDKECVQGGMMATLSYLSFLPDVVQRTAVTAAAAMAARTGADTMPVALEVVPHLLNLLEDCKDSAILNSACSALNHITSAAARCAAVHLVWFISESMICNGLRPKRMVEGKPPTA